MSNFQCSMFNYLKQKVPLLLAGLFDVEVLWGTMDPVFAARYFEVILF